SRRSFLQATAIGLAGIASAGSLGACAKAGSTAGTSTSNVEVNGINYEIINTDLLVIGGGNSAFSIAAQGLAEGQYVTIVDKGVFKHSGTSGMSWDAFSPGIIPDDPSEDLRMSQYFNQQINGDALKNALDFDPEPNKFVYAINHGQTLPDRNEDGTVANYAMDRWCQSLFFRREGDPLSDSQKASIIDRTMITNLLVNEGRCLGAMGIHLPTGEFKVFRAPATVIATGGCTWIYGWFTVAACTIGTADNTADVDMAGYRLGLGIGDAEYCQYDVMSSYPPGLATGFGSGVCGDAQEAHAIVDKNGDPIFDADDKNVLSRVYFNQQMGRIIVEEDRGTENGGVFIDVGNSHLRYSNDRNKAVLAKFGVDVTQEKIEAMPEMYEHGGTPVIDENMMTEFEGLFHARGAGTAGENGG
ncbi:MAG: FAD-binding protein, partial [Raoultibacter sp.]